MRSNCLKALVAASVLAGLSSVPGLAEFKLDGPPKVAMIIFAQKNDGGWSQAFDEARQRMEKSMGITIPYVENVPENATAIQPPAELFISKGYNVIIGSAFGYSDTFKALAEKYCRDGSSLPRRRTDYYPMTELLAGPASRRRSRSKPRALTTASMTGGTVNYFGCASPKF